MKKIRRRNEVTASFTVEAAMVMPIVLFVVIALIYMSFYLHDFCVIRSISDQMVSELCHVKEGGTGMNAAASESESFLSQNFSVLGLQLSEEKKNMIYNTMQGSLEGKLFLLSYKSCEVSMAFQKVTLQVYAKGGVSSRYVQRILPPLNIHITSYGTVHQPAVSVRAEKLIFDEFEKSKVFDGIQSLLSKVREYIS